MHILVVFSYVYIVYNRCLHNPMTWSFWKGGVIFRSRISVRCWACWLIRLKKKRFDANGTQHVKFHNRYCSLRKTSIAIVRETGYIRLASLNGYCERVNSHTASGIVILGQSEAVPRDPRVRGGGDFGSLDYSSFGKPPEQVLR